MDNLYGKERVLSLGRVSFVFHTGRSKRYSPLGTLVGEGKRWITLSFILHGDN